jgi:hypothetical protein
LVVVVKKCVNDSLAWCVLFQCLNECLCCFGV